MSGTTAYSPKTFTTSNPCAHRFEKFDSTRIYCIHCGEFKTAPFTWPWMNTDFPYQWTYTSKPGDICIKTI
jgi:hypothetical protein